MLALEIIVVLALFVLNGFFAMAELAIVTSRRAHLERLVKERRPGAQIALSLADDPARVLATVQIGVTASASLAGIVSGATLAERLAQALLVFPGIGDYGKPLAIIIVTIGVAYVALVIGELVPKHIGLNNPEAIAIRVARPLAVIARAAAPAIWLLNVSTRLLLRLVNLRPRFERTLTEDDIHWLVAEGARLGVIHNVERDMIEGVLDLADSPVRTIMTPRPDVHWVNLDSPKDVIVKRIRTCAHAQLLVCRGSIDEVVGIVRKQDLADQILEGREPDIAQVTRPPLIVHEFDGDPANARSLSQDAGPHRARRRRVRRAARHCHANRSLGNGRRRLAEDQSADPAQVTRREDGSFLIDASTPFPDAMRLIGMIEAPPGDYVTVAGFILSQLHELPKPGDHVLWGNWRFEVVDMDGGRIDAVLAQQEPTPP